MPDTLNRLKAALANRYRIERKLGAGGMATVYLARDLKHERLVAIKVLKPELAAALGHERFLREITTLAGLSHPHILPLHDSGEAHGLLYYVMPYVEGESLRDRLNRETQLPLEDALHLAGEIADALAYAHSRGIIHRDIKPENIMLSGRHAVVADFGIAAAIGAARAQKLTQTGMSIGTPPYMSPEQAAGDEKVDGRSDVYSLGCVVYEMLAGEPPFTGPTPQAIMARHALDPIPSLRTVRPAVTDSLEQSITQALAKIPADRFKTAADFGSALVTSLLTIGTDPTPAVRQPISAPTKVRSWRIPRQRVWLVAAGVSLTIAVAVLAWRIVFPRGDNLDLNRIVVFPLVSSAQFSDTEGEDTATMIGHAVDGVGQLRWIDGWRLLSGEQRLNIRTLTAAPARSLARAQRAGYYLTGRMVKRADSTIVLLDLVDVGGDSTVATADGTVGSSEASWVGGLRAVNKLLPVLIPGSGLTVVDPWSGHDPAAVASFLLGEQLFRRGRFADALIPYHQAVADDSTFMFPAMRGAQAYTWLDIANPSDFDQARHLVQIALRSADRLAPRYRHFLLGFEAYLDARADDAVAELQQAIAADPDMAVAWLQLGETYRHLLPSDPQPDSLAAAAYGEALRIDPMAVASLYHPLQFAIRRGDTAEARPYHARFLAHESGSALAWMADIGYTCVRDGPEAVNWKEMAAEDANHLVSVGWNLGKTGAQITCARAAFEAVLSREVQDEHSWYALLGIQSFLLADDQDSIAALRLSRASEELDRGFFLRLVILDAVVASKLDSMADENARFFEDRYGENYHRARATSWLWLFANWERHRGRPHVVAAITEEVRRRATESGKPEEGVLADALEGHLALARGDSAEAVMRFAALKPVALADSIPWNMAQPLGVERLLLAQLYLARGEYRAALDVASLFDSLAPAYYLVFLRTSLEVRQEAAERLGDRRLASYFADRLAALRNPS